MTPEQFLPRWQTLVTVWDRRRSTDPSAADQLVRDVLGAGLAAIEVPDLDEAPTREAALACAVALVEASAALDGKGYRANNPDIQQLRSGKKSPAEHFCSTGWMWLRNPNADFDVWWYWNEYLDPTSLEINPFLHYLLAGRQAGNRTRQGRHELRPAPPTADEGTRRVCLFAAHDPDGVVDDSVVAYLAALAEHADVFYLADRLMPDSELAKLSGVTKGSWSVPHGRSAIGSYSLLAKELVGWEVIDQYDELLLANDSCYLLRPLDGVFARMDAVPADWWGLVALKRDHARERGADGPLPLDVAKALHNPDEAWSPDHRLHLDPSFLLLRKRAMSDSGFRRRLDTVTEQAQEGMAALKYDVGLSDYLITEGFDFATYTDSLHPFHPLFSTDFFDLLDQGLPLMKRSLIGENPGRVPDLAQWKARVHERVPQAPVDVLERNLLRVSPDDRLRASLAIRTREDGTVDEHAPMSRAQFRLEDLRTPKFDHWWAFPVCRYDHTFAGNERAVFEEVRDDPSIKKIILTRSRRVEAEGENVVIVPLDSPEGQHYLLRAGQIFVKHGPMINVPWPLAPTLHNFINTWHGIPLKRFGLPSVKMSDPSRAIIVRNNGASRAVVTSSRMDSLAMSAAFYPAAYPDMWPTGLPRNDFILRDEDRLPADLHADLQRLRDEAAGRRLVMFMPTFKEGQAEAYYRFTPEQIEHLGSWLERNNAVLAVREHMADLAHTYSRMLAPLDPIDLSSARYSSIEVLYRAADLLISDYSSCLVDFMLTGKPLISFTYDFDAYSTKERGLFYDLEKVLPGPVCRSFEDLADALEDVFREPRAEELEAYDWKRRIFFDHLDDGASARLVRRVKGLYIDLSDDEACEERTDG